MTRRKGILWAIGVCAAVLAGCGGDDPTPPTAVAPTAARQRIVCLSPAMTQIIEDLGAIGRVVGVSPWDPAASIDVPIVGDLHQIDYERLLSVRPTDIVMQITREGVPLRLEQLAARRGWRIWRWKLEDRATVLRTIWDPQSPEGQINDSISGMLGDADAGRRLARSVRARLGAIARVTGGEDKARVLLVVRPEPIVMAATRGTFVDEMLGVAGGRNAVTGSTLLYPELDAEALLAIRPDVVLYLPPHDPPRELRLPDSLGAPVLTLADRRSLLPSSTMPLIAAQMAKLLYPRLADEIDAAVAAADAPASTAAGATESGDE